VVNKVEVHGDPLEESVLGASFTVKGWVYMGWLENVTLEQFTDRARIRSGPLPNRLVWRLLICRESSFATDSL